ncbi:anti-sigma factor [soil metagenome]
MNYGNAQLQDRLAAEYVLGTLRGRARRHMQKLLPRHGDWQRRVIEWEERLMPLNDELAPVTPRASVWRAVERKLGLGGAQPASRGPGWLWPALTAGFALLSLALGWLLLDRPPEQPYEPAPPSYVSVIPDEDDRALWLLEVREDRILTRAVADIPPESGRSYELWMLPADGSPPISLGLLPRAGSLESVLTQRQLTALGKAGGVAVSLEPEGGSPTGQPSGPVVYTAPLARS